MVLLTSSGNYRGGYEGRISVSQSHVTLSTVTGADEGSYTVRDAKGTIMNRLCLNVIGEGGGRMETHFHRCPHLT